MNGYEAAVVIVLIVALVGMRVEARATRREQRARRESGNKEV